MYRPGKKIIALAILAIAVVSSVAIGRFGGSLSNFGSIKKFFGSREKSAKITAENPDSSKQGFSDSDSDGLLDWEEVLWGSDIKNPDSDSDGAIDGDEVRNGRNPTVKGPGDELSENQKKLQQDLASANSSAEPAKPVTYTDAAARDLFSGYITLKQTDSLNSTTTQSLVDGVVGWAEGDFAYKAYARSGLRAVPSDSKETLKAYASGYASIMYNLLLSVQGNQKAVNADLKVLAGMYENTAKNLYDLEVPQLISTEHLRTVNNFSIAAEALSQIAASAGDPVKSSVLIGYYRKAVENQDEVLTQIAEFLRKNDIIFTQDEIGNYWNNF